MKRVSERRRKASVIRTCVGLLGPKSGNVEIMLVFKAFLKRPWDPDPPQAGGRAGGFLALFLVENASY